MLTYQAKIDLLANYSDKEIKDLLATRKKLIQKTKDLQEKILLAENALYHVDESIDKWCEDMAKEIEAEKHENDLNDKANDYQDTCDCGENHY